MLCLVRDAFRGSTILVLLNLLAVAADAQSVSPSTGSEPKLQEWPRFLGSGFDGIAPDGSGSNMSGKIDWSQAPRFMWSIDLGEGYGIGSVAGGRYFQFDAEGGQLGRGTRERLRCFDLKTGELLWSKSEPLVYRDLLGYEEGPRSSPTIVGDKVLTYGVVGQLICRRVSDGELLWSVDTNDRFGVVQNFFGVGSSPMVLGDLVVAMVGGSPVEDQSIPPGQLDRVIPNGSAAAAFDLNSGKLRWKCGDDLASYSSPRPIRLGDETLILMFARGGLLAIDPVEGEVRWRYEHRASKLESVNAIVPVVDGDRVFVSECYQIGSVLLKVSGDSAEVVWKDGRSPRDQAMRSHWSTPVLVDGYLYGCSGRNPGDSDFRCIEFATGEVQWIDPRRTRSSVTVVGDDLVVLEERGRLQVLKVNPSKMEEIAVWDLSEGQGDRPPLRYPCWSAPVVVGNQMIARGNRHVVSLELASAGLGN